MGELSPAEFVRQFNWSTSRNQRAFREALEKIERDRKKLMPLIRKSRMLVRDNKETDTVEIEFRATLRRMDTKAAENDFVIDALNSKFQQHLKSAMACSETFSEEITG